MQFAKDGWLFGRAASKMYVIKLLRGGSWVSWASAANPRVINQYIDLLRTLHPGIEYMVATP